MSAILDSESIEWIAVKDRLPDDDTTVLVCSPNSHEPVWLGWYDGCFWFGVDATEYEDDTPVVAWAPMPKGPV
jgi:Protein of unknown function (DUF551)